MQGDSFADACRPEASSIQGDTNEIPQKSAVAVMFVSFVSFVSFVPFVSFVINR